MKRKINMDGKLPFVNAGIFGPKMSGKTTLGKELSKQMWFRLGRKSLVLDPYAHENDWGNWSWVTTNEPHFWQIVNKGKGYLVIVDEATQTINQEKLLTPVFTAMSHREHQLLVMGHRGTNLLPIMREQLDRIYLFRQPEPAAKQWSETFCHDGLMDATRLRQYEFIDYRQYQDNHAILTLQL